MRRDVLRSANNRLAGSLANGVVGVVGGALCDGVLALKRRQRLLEVGHVEVGDDRVASAVVGESVNIAGVVRGAAATEGRA